MKNNIFDLSDKVAVVTGGAGHLCGAIVKSFYELGCKIAIIDLRKKKIDLILKEIKNFDKNRIFGIAAKTLKKKNYY